MSVFKQIALTAVLSVSVAMPAFASETPALPAFSATETQMLFEQDAKPMQLAALSQSEMKETEGAWWFVALPVARFAMWAAPKIAPNTFRVVENLKSQHTLLFQNNVHKLHIGTDKFGPHVGWGTNAKNHAQYHIYQNNPWKINPY